MDNKTFEEAKLKVLLKKNDPHGFGTLKEKTVHAIMKLYYEPDEDFHEVPIEGYIADIYNGNQIIEIQNGNFNKLRAKLEAYRPHYAVKIVLPIPHTKWLIWVDEQSGELSAKHKSPLTGTIYDAFRELYRIKPFIGHPNLSFAFPLIDMDEYRLLNGWSADRKKGSCRYDRVPLTLYDEILIERVEDFRQLIPYELPEPFTVKEFGKAAGIRHKTAEVTVPFLLYLKLLERVGKRGREYLYVTVD